MLPSDNDHSVSESQEMQNQVETLHLHEDVKRLGKEENRRLDSSNASSSFCDSEADGARCQETTSARSDQVNFYTSDLWRKFYPNQEVVVVTNIGKPPIPAEGYIPLRHGHRRDAQNPAAGTSLEDDVPNGFSLDTLLWNEELLEQRIMQLTAWTRRSPLPRHQKLERINRMINQCDDTNAKEVN